MDKDLALKVIETELSSSYIHEDVRNHYLKLKEIVNDPKPQYDGMKILVFQPISTGDIVVSSICAELFQIKYPGCVVDYCIEADVARDLLVGNPFTRDIIVTRNWDLVKKRDTLELGALAKEYDAVYSLYWWDAKPNMITSWLEDLQLPTDYTRVRIYTKYYHEETADEVLKNQKRPLIMLQSDLGPKWDNQNKYNDLKTKLEKYGNVIESGGKHITYGVTASMLRRCMLFIGAHGSLEHVAAAIGCQTITLSTIYKPEHVMVPFYQNKYRKSNEQCQVVRPKNWCGDFNRCITYVPTSVHHKQPPYGYPYRFPPHMDKPCDYNGFKKTCVHEISVDEIIEVVDHTMEMRNEKA